jgi:uncharacterized membrane protein YcaP (DUF421 family)
MPGTRRNEEDLMTTPSWLFSGAGTLGPTAAKAALMYLTALLGLRVAHRRTLAQWSAIDFAAAVAVGAIVGRTAVASSQSLLVGVVALVTILAAHTAITFGRFLPWVPKVTDHRVRVLVEHGRIRRRQLLICGLTESDLFAHLRQQGVHSLPGVRYVLYETKGDLTVVPEDPVHSRTEDEPLIARGIGAAQR